VIDSSRMGSRAIAVVAAWYLAAVPMFAEDTALKLRAAPIGSAVTPLTIDLYRWSTDAERAPLLVALSAPPPSPPTTAAPAPTGRGGRGGRGTAPPASPLARLTTAIKAAPTVGFIWGSGPTGYSIKYAWHSSQDGGDRIVLVTDRRLGAHEPSWPQAFGATTDADFTVIEMRIDGKGGEAKASLTTAVVVDAEAKTLALDGYAAAPALLKVTR
jgi:hypothetical protein